METRPVIKINGFNVEESQDVYDVGSKSVANKQKAMCKSDAVRT